MDLAHNLQINRCRSHYSREELAEICQVSRQAVAKWESGESAPAIEKLIFLADLYKVSLDELVGRMEGNDLLEEYIKRFVPTDVKLGVNDETTEVICRFLRFLAEHEIRGEEAFKGFKTVFLGDKD